MSYQIVSVVLGIVFAAPYLYLANTMKPELKRHFLGVGLVVAALVYVGFGLTAWLSADETNVADEQSWDFGKVMLLELSGLVVYGVCYPLTIYFQSDRWLALGWILHPLWDLLLHWGDAPAAHIAPEWYVWMCVSFDVVVFGYIFYPHLTSKKGKGS